MMLTNSSYAAHVQEMRQKLRIATGASTSDSTRSNNPSTYAGGLYSIQHANRPTLLFPQTASETCPRTPHNLCSPDVHGDQLAHQSLRMAHADLVDGGGAYQITAASPHPSLPTPSAAVAIPNQRSSPWEDPGSAPRVHPSPGPTGHAPEAPTGWHTSFQTRTELEYEVLELRRQLAVSRLLFINDYSSRPNAKDPSKAHEAGQHGPSVEKK